jgi:alpha-D-ribose 1-methylphosphonate 5-triphosphate synthase subunit PhnL
MITAGWTRATLYSQAVHETVATGEVVVEHEHAGVGVAELLRELGHGRRRRDHGHVRLRLDEPP